MAGGSVRRSRGGVMGWGPGMLSGARRGIGLALVVVAIATSILAIPAAASASTKGPSGYQAWNIRGVSAAKSLTTRISLLFWKKPGTDKQTVWKCRASTRSTKYYIDVIEHGSLVTKKVSFKTFRHYNGGKLMSFQWVWKRPAHGTRYRYIKRIHSSKPEYTGFQ
jgi:hypothetical protein